MCLEYSEKQGALVGIHCEQGGRLVGPEGRKAMGRVR